MNHQEYQALLSNQLCELALTDKAEQKKIIEHIHQLELNDQKSANRRKEYVDRQAAKIVSTDIFIDDDCVIYETLNGMNTRLSKGILFNCLLDGVRRYRFDGEREYFFQLLVVEGNTKNRIVSDLYPEKMLRSVSKLKDTMLAQYEVVYDGKYKRMGWEWMKKRAGIFYEAAPAILIPSKPGWFWDGKRYRFCSKSEQEIWFYSKNIQQFSVRKFDEQDVEATVEELFLRSMKLMGETKMGVLLLYRLSILLGRLVADEPFPITLTLVGMNAEKIARSFLCVFESDNDGVNLDSDSISFIKSRIRSLQDTPLLLFTSDPNGKSTQNRVHQIMSWLNTGHMSDIKVRIPFVFCLKNYSHWFPLDETVILDMDDVVYHGYDETFAQIQNFLTATIEESGAYWVNELKRSYQKFSLSEDDNERRLPLFYAVVEIVLIMLKSKLQSETYLHFNNILEKGVGEIIRQVTMKNGILLEVFNDAVLDIVDQGHMLVIKKDMVPERNLGDCIFYDAKYYYFTLSILNKIGQRAKIDTKSLLFLRQMLFEQGMIKTYKYSRSASQELQIDFRIRMENGTVNDLSGIAVLRNFWDAIGGINLYERSREFYA